MKRIITIVLMACAFASTVLAAGDEEYKGVRIGFDVDYTAAFMDQVNADLNEGSDVKNIGTGITGMLDLDLAVTPFLMVGIRSGYLYCMPASADYLLDNLSITYNASLIPVEAGAVLNIEIPGVPISIMAGAYGGYGFAAASVQKDISIVDATYTQPYNGGVFMGEVLARVNYKVSSGLSLNINGGFRQAKVLQMTQSEDVTYDLLGIPTSAGEKGDVLQDSDSNDLAFDFSGFSVGAGLSLGF